MTFGFYLFNVDHGQAAAARLPNGRWCIFDAGRSESFSPIQLIIANEHYRTKPPWAEKAPWLHTKQPPFRFLKATISHHHSDHLYDYMRLFAASPQFFKTVELDKNYIADVLETTSKESFPRVINFFNLYRKWRQTNLISEPIPPNYGAAIIIEKSIPIRVVRDNIGGQTNSRVNNASIITRIECYKNSILICGDMEEEGWDFIFNNKLYSMTWKKFVSNVDILIAPHHGHCYSTHLMDLAKPSIVLVSLRSGDESIDKRYSGEAVSGLNINGKLYKCITTRKSDHINISISRPASISEKGLRSWSGLS
ncbi:MAG: hypothetical protein LUQ65_13630 [Candidatus Helarchaeota archaeon]|nr:hypothetical protein [Candidatus Helarchaeota archaeon]